MRGGVQGGQLNLSRGEPAAGNSRTGESEPGARPPRRRAIGWWVTFLVLAVTAIVAVGHYTGVEVLAASGRFLWNALAAVANGAMRTAGGLLAVIARGVGWRRLSGISRVVMRRRRWWRRR